MKARAVLKLVDRDRSGCSAAMAEAAGAPPATVLLGVKLGERALDLVMELARAWGWRLLSLEALRKIPGDLLLDGALIDALPDTELAARLRERGCPAVRLGHYVHPEDSLLPAVLPDIEAAGRLAAEHFVERGFRELAFVSWHASSARSTNHPRYLAFCNRAKALGADLQHLDFTEQGEVDWTAAERVERRTHQLGEWLRKLPKPVGIFTVGDGMAIDICEKCASMHIKVPEEVGVLGYGNTDVCSLVRLPVSSVDPDPLGQARAAMQLLRRLMRGAQPPEAPEMVPPAGVVDRRSTDVLAVRDPLVAKAIRYIWEHVQVDPAVDDVATALGVPRRTLERVFRQETGTSLKAEIRRRRLQLYCRTLRTSDEPIATLSARLGYRSTEAMNRQFRQAMGTTPDRYRRAMR